VGAHVYGISSDSPAANKAFAESQRLPFPLLTDPAGALRKVGGVRRRRRRIRRKDINKDKQSAALPACAHDAVISDASPLLVGRRTWRPDASHCSIAIHLAPPSRIRCLWAWVLALQSFGVTGNLLGLIPGAAMEYFCIN
jgi:hypothetical protein